MRESLREKRGNLYMARNKITDDFYIGITSVKLNQRRLNHESNARNQKYNSILHSAIRKYGPENFIWTKIGSMENYKDALDMEVHLIKEMSPKYNSTGGGEGWLGRKMSEENKSKLILSKVGKKRPIETIEKIRKSLTGKKRYVSPEELIMLKENVKKLHEIRKNNPKPNSEKQRLAASLCGKQKRKKVICVDDNLIFESATSAAKNYGVEITRISKVCLRGGKVNGKRFRYDGQELVIPTTKKRAPISEETRKKLSFSHKGQRPWMIGRKHTQESIEKMRETHRKNPTNYWLGKKRSAETVEKIRIARLGKPAHNKKTVQCLNDGNIFNSASEAALFYNIPISRVAKVCRGKANHTKNLKFKYIEEGQK